LFPQKYWPRAIGVNGMLLIEGKKMSKSKGNFLTLSKTVDEFGADVTRMTLILGAEDMEDPDWRVENAKSIDSKLHSLYRFINEIANMQGEDKPRSIDRWLISVLQGRIKAVSEAIENLKTRTAAEIAFFEVWNDIRWYLRRVDKPNPKTLKKVADVWVRLLAPFTPHICEEMWRLLKRKGFISVAEWPVYDKEKVDVAAEESEDIIRSLINDTLNIMEATKKTPKRICYYVAADWKWKVYLEILRKALSARVEIRDMMRALMKDQELREKAKKISAYVGKLLPEINVMSEDQKRRRVKAKRIDEEALLNEAKELFEKEFKAEILIYNEDDSKRYDPMNRANLAKPYRPAIYIE